MIFIYPEIANLVMVKHPDNWQRPSYHSVCSGTYRMNQFHLFSSRLPSELPRQIQKYALLSLTCSWRLPFCLLCLLSLVQGMKKFQKCHPHKVQAIQKVTPTSRGMFIASLVISSMEGWIHDSTYLAVKGLLFVFCTSFGLQGATTVFTHAYEVKLFL